MTQQQQCNTSSAARIDDAVEHESRDCAGMVVRLRAVGRRGAAPMLAGEALACYWRLVASTSVDRRLAMLRELRDDIAAGHTTVRACVPVALGDPEFHVAHEAARAYVGGWPASVDRRAQVVDEVIDWIVRGLALDRAALCCALLDSADPACLERLAGVRTRLQGQEAAVVFAAFRGGQVDAHVARFLEEWRALSEAAESVAK